MGSVRPKLLDTMGDLAYRLRNATETRLPRNYFAGLQTTIEDTDDVNIAAGECRDSSNSVNIVLTGDLAKKIDTTWAVGNDQGGLNATNFAADGDGTLPNITYHLFLIKHGDGTVDAGFDKSTTATNLLSDTGYTWYRRVGSYPTDATAGPNANMYDFFQVGNQFMYRTIPADSAFTSEAEDTARTVTLLGAPTGFKFLLNINAEIDDDNEGFLYISSLDQVNQNAGEAGEPLAQVHCVASETGMAQVLVRSNVSGQFRVTAVGQGVGGDVNAIRFCLQGWFDDLGQYD